MVDAAHDAARLVGEIGLFAPDNRRIRAIAGVTNCALHALSAEALAQRYWQNPKLGYHVMRLFGAQLPAMHT